MKKFVKASLVAAMLAVGHDIRREYRETAMGGLATTPTGKAVAEKVHRFQEFERGRATI